MKVKFFRLIQPIKRGLVSGVESSSSCQQQKLIIAQQAVAIRSDLSKHAGSVLFAEAHCRALTDTLHWSILNIPTMSSEHHPIGNTEEDLNSNSFQQTFL